MNLLPIQLSVKRKAFRADSPHPNASDKAYIEARKKTLERDNFTCLFCGYRNAKNEVHHMDDDHENHHPDNLKTACVLCHMSFHIAFAGIKGRGKLIYLPEVSITQADLNQLVRQLWVAEQIGSGDLQNHATHLLARLEKAEILAATVIGTSSPAMLGDHLASLSDAEYQERSKVLEGIFLLPIKAAYDPYIKLWVKDAANFGPKDWVDTARTRFAEWGGLD